MKHDVKANLDDTKSRRLLERSCILETKKFSVTSSRQAMQHRGGGDDSRPRNQRGHA
jgi:hypothetical protein